MLIDHTTVLSAYFLSLVLVNKRSLIQRVKATTH